MKRFVIALFALVALAACTGSRTEGLDPSKVPDDVRGDYQRFAHKCSKCHSLARPLTSGITDDEQWAMYVNRMRRQPGSGISMADQEVILRFLRWYAADLRRIQAEKKGASAPPAPPAPPPVAPSPAPPAPAPDGGGT
ncbi:MAG: hypothetical protein KF819_27465 [Labilithrix sp.]|nr:hypothetical protein [Labilithrix sp.]